MSNKCPSSEKVRIVVGQAHRFSWPREAALAQMVDARGTFLSRKEKWEKGWHKMGRRWASNWKTGMAMIRELYTVRETW